MVTRDQNLELNLRIFSNVGPSWPDVHKVRLRKLTHYIRDHTSKQFQLIQDFQGICSYLLVNMWLCLCNPLYSESTFLRCWYSNIMCVCCVKKIVDNCLETILLGLRTDQTIWSTITNIFKTCYMFKN